MATTTEYDTNNEFDWAERTTSETTLFGTVYKDVTTTFDDGHIEAESFRNDALTRFSLTDPTDALPIESQLITYALNGDVTSSNTLDDAGQRTVGTYEAGVLTGETITDESMQRPWSSVEVVFDGGEVDSFAVNYEQAGTEGWDANFLTDISYDQAGTEDWMFIVDARSGSTNTVITIDDQGGWREERIEDGVTTRVQEYDYGDQAEWGEILTQFDSDGVITTRFTFNDDGTNFIESFEAGVLTMTRLQDDGQTQPFRAIETFFDADGHAVRRETTDDNGVLSVEILRETTVQTDTAGTAGWDQITTVRNGDGQLVERETIYDNGNVKFESYDAGQITQRLITEADGDTRVTVFEDGQRVTFDKVDVSNSKGWTTQHTEYDANNKVAAKSISYDNGTTTDISYLDGVVVSNVRADVEDAFGWSAQVSLYDAGQLSARKTDYDNGDAQILVWEDGDRTARLKVDGDDSHAWEVQLTEFGAEGAVTTNFAASEDVPAKYASLLAADAFGLFG